MKKLIAVAVLGALAAPAFADSGNVTISGDVRGGYEHKNSALGANSTSQNEINGRGNIIFSGSEDLGNGTKAIFQVKNRFGITGNADSGAGNTFANKASWVGLSGSWGKVRIGHGESLYGDGKYDNAVWYGDDPIIGSHADYKNTNMLRYDFPAMGNFSGGLAFYAGEDKTNNATGVNRAANTYQGRLDYDAENWNVGFGFESGTVKLDSDSWVNSTGYAYTGKSRVRNWIAAAGLKFGDFDAGIEYSDNRVKDIGGADVHARNKTLGLYLNYTAGKLGMSLQYFGQKANGGAAGSNVTEKGRTWTASLRYAMSKRTQVFTEIWSGKLSGDATTDAQERKRTKFLVGMKHSF